MSKYRSHQTEAPGQDSFLDVIANLVGIILVLIMCVGSQAKDAFVTAIESEMKTTAPVGPRAPTKLEREATEAEAAAQTVEKNFQLLANKMQREQFEIDYRRTERDRISTLVTAAEQVLNEKRAALTDAQKAEYDLYAELNVARRQLRDLKLAKSAALNAPTPPGVIEHLPTPLAKTVFGKELHLRLQKGKITFVPLNELVAKLKEDAPQNTWKLKDATRITEVVGPLDGFRLKYTLAKVERAQPTQGGVQRGVYVELERFYLIPVTEDLGEPMAVALQQGSGLRSLLKEYPPERSTVTVWVYPESFDQFRQLKAELFKLGYATAGRPMPEGHPIGGSPDGSHSAAQ